MECRAALAAGLVLAGLAGGMGGCAVVDQYSGRAVVYNLEAEQAQEQALLLNVVRSSLRRPMQFTSVSNIVGIATATGTANLTVPLGPHSGSLPWSGLFSGSVSGGPQFTTGVLDTQEFYRGILQGIPGELIDLLIHANYSRELLFSLLIEKIEMTRLDDGCSETSHWTDCEFFVVNDPTSDTQIELFHTLVRYLVALGMTTEPLRRPGAEPPKPPKSDDKADPLPVPYVFCFAPKNRVVQQWLVGSPICWDYASGANGKKSKSKPSATATVTVTGTGTATASATVSGPGASKPADARSGSETPANVTASGTGGATGGGATASGSGSAAIGSDASGRPVPRANAAAETQAPGGSSQRVEAKSPPSSARNHAPSAGSGKSAEDSIKKAEIKKTSVIKLMLIPAIVDDLQCVTETYDHWPDSIENYEFLATFLEKFRRKQVQLRFYMRSTAGLLNYLGQI